MKRATLLSCFLAFSLGLAVLAHAATVTWTASTNTLTIVLTDAEKSILQRAIQDHGANTVKDLLGAWLQDRANYQDDLDRVDMLKRLKKLSPADQQTIRTLLQSVNP